MDPKKAEKVNVLAKSLKDNHLAANMEEATEKAKQILGVAAEEEAEQKADEAPKEEGDGLKTVEELFNEEKEAGDAAEEADKELEDIKKEIEQAEKQEKKEEAEIADMEREICEDEEKLAEMKESEN